jgi:hypothetical protein
MGTAAKAKIDPGDSSLHILCYGAMVRLTSLSVDSLTSLIMCYSFSLADGDVTGWKSVTLGLHGCYIAQSKCVCVLGGGSARILFSGYQF